MENEKDPVLLNALESIPVAELSRQEWIMVGMALKDKGYSLDVWDSWSQNDSRYRPDGPGSCKPVWESFNGSGVKAGSIIELAKEYGWIEPSHRRSIPIANPFADREISDIESIPYDRPVNVKPVFDTFDPVKEIKHYLYSLFKPDDIINVVNESSYVEDSGKFIPKTKGYSSTRDDFVSRLESYHAQHPEDYENLISYTFGGETNCLAGGWIRINPLDGKDVKNRNVVDFKYALIECDNMTPYDQKTLIENLNLPVKIMVYSGKKSVHAIVMIDAINEVQYKERVLKLYSFCEEHGLKIDKQNQNPARLSRLPGLYRGDATQFICSLESGCKSYAEWEEYVEVENAALPPVLDFDDFADEQIILAEPVIEGVLRKGHKCIISGPSKAGKSFLAIELAEAIRTGGTWLGHKCKTGNVLYINLENDEPSSKKRMQDVDKALNHGKNHEGKIFTWNLRSAGMTISQLQKHVIKKSLDNNIDVIIVDPVYKIMEGDENKASDMGAFTAKLDQIAEHTKASIIYIHHFSKGAQSHKASIDRASGSGVFGRDGDAIITIIQLAMPYQWLSREFEQSGFISDCETVLAYYAPAKYDQLVHEMGWLKPDIDAGSDAWDEFWETRAYPNEYAYALIDQIRKLSAINPHPELEKDLDGLNAWYRSIKACTAWQADFNTREFASPEPIRFVYKYPLHLIDDDRFLDDAPFIDEADQIAKKKKREEKAEQRKLEREEKKRIKDQEKEEAVKRKEEEKEQKKQDDLKILEGLIFELMGSDHSRILRTELEELIKDKGLKGFSRQRINGKLEESELYKLDKDASHRWVILKRNDT